MKKLRNISVLYRYLISYFSIILLVAAAIGLFLFNASIKELNSATKKETEKKLSLAAADLGNQHDIMKDIALSIATTLYYKPNYRDRGKFYETVIIEDFAKYEGRTPIADDYFMFYKNDDWVYKKTAKNTFDVYAKTYLDVEDGNTLYQKLNSVEDFEIILPEDGGENWILFAYNVPISRYLEDKENACLCFVTHASTIKNRIINAAGLIEGDITLSYLGEAFAYISDALEENAKEKNSLFASSPEGMFGVLLHPKNTTYDGLSYFLRINLVAIIVFVVLFLGLSALVAYQNYRPIKELAARYDIPDHDAAERKDELRSIDSMLSNVLEKQRVSQARLGRQFAQLKKQQLLLILNGEYSEEDASKGPMELTLAGPYYGVAAIRVKSLKPDEKEKLISLIEDLSDEEITFYCVELKQENCFAVILGMRSDELIGDAFELIKEVLETAEIKYLIGIGSIYHDLRRMPASLLAALSSCDLAGSAEENPEKEMEKPQMLYDERPISKMIAEIRGGHPEQAKEQFEIFIENILAEQPSVIIMRSIFADVSGKILKLSYEIHAPLTEEEISSIMICRDMESFRSGIVSLIGELSDNIRSAHQRHSSELLSNILTYIDTHALGIRLKPKYGCPEFRDYRKPSVPCNKRRHRENLQGLCDFFADKKCSGLFDRGRPLRVGNIAENRIYKYIALYKNVQKGYRAYACEV